MADEKSTFTFDSLYGLWNSCYGPQMELLAQEVDDDDGTPRPFVPKTRKENEVFIYGELLSEERGYYRSWYSPRYYTTASMVREQIAAAGGSLRLRVNSIGGNFGVASAIRLMLQEFKRAGGEITALIEGMDASASTVITQMASMIEIADLGSMMIHRTRTRIPSIYRSYTAPQIERDFLSEMQSKVLYMYDQDEAMARIYSDKTGDSVQHWLDVMDANTYFSAKSAMDKGLVDAIFE